MPVSSYLTRRGERSTYDSSAGWNWALPDHVEWGEWVAFDDNYYTSPEPIYIDPHRLPLSSPYPSPPSLWSPQESSPPSTPTALPSPIDDHYSKGRRRSKQVSTKPAEFLCLRGDCPRAMSGFARKADLQRHDQFVHNRQSAKLHDCGYEPCDRKGSKGFTRKDKMVEHMREVHKVLIPKRSARKDSLS